jgi:ElaB/YqjD/DUF883 family membrane-anchored ribosome-binding protein
VTNSSAADTDLSQLIADVQTLKRDIAALAGHSRGAAAGAASALGAEAQRLYENVAAQGRHQAEALGHQVEAHPLASLLIAFGIGFVAGRILPR